MSRGTWRVAGARSWQTGVVRLFKILPTALWEARAQVLPTAPIDQRDGFMHLSAAWQLRETAQKHFSGQRHLTWIALDSGQIDRAALRWEVSRDGALFPHVYGAVPLTAVLQSGELVGDRPGEFAFGQDVTADEARRPSERSLDFSETDDARFPFAARVDGAEWRVRVNEFPEEATLYSLFIDGMEVEQLLHWPKAWQRPRLPGNDEIERGTYERELAHAFDMRHVRPSKLVKKP